MSLDAYRALCRAAALDPAVFASFIRHPVYTPILEHVSFEQGQAYLECIQKQHPELLACADRFRTSDIGGPVVFEYPGLGVFSPTTLRYVKVAADFLDLFGSWESKTVLELGGGYGGQCKILHDLYRPAQYVIVDLPEVLALTGCFFARTGVENVQLSAPVPVQAFDLFISNYAFTELGRAAQQDYLDGGIARSKHGYMLCNFISSVLGVDSYTREELLARVPHAFRVEPENPVTDPSNFLLVW